MSGCVGVALRHRHTGLNLPLLQGFEVGLAGIASIRQDHVGRCAGVARNGLDRGDQALVVAGIVANFRGQDQTAVFIHRRLRVGEPRSDVFDYVERFHNGTIRRRPEGASITKDVCMV